MKIGLPRALVYYYYYPLWKKLFEELGHETVVSDPTNGGLLEKGIKVTVSELCVPIKIFNAHVINLLEKEVDYCFVPRLISVGEEWFCPKFLGLTSVVRFSIPEIEDKLLTCDIEGKKNNDIGNVKNYYALCEPLGVDKKTLKAAFKKASDYFEEFRVLCRQGYTIDEADQLLRGVKVPPPPDDYEITIGVLGYVYNVYDKFVSMDIIKRLRAAKARVITFESMDEALLENRKKEENKPLFWVFARKLYNAGRHLLENQTTDGLIHITAFACGPDSVIGKMFEVDCEEAKIPFMTIRVDEHSGESHVQTRIEAFCDLIKRKKQKLAKV